MSSGFSGRGKRVPRATAPAADAAGRGSAASADSGRGRRGCACPTMRGAAGRRIAPGTGAFDSAKGAHAMHAAHDGRGRDRHGPIGRLASSRTGHEAIGSRDATAGVCALGVRDLHAFSLHRVRTVLTAAHRRVNEARNFSLSNCSRVVRRMESTTRGAAWGTKMDSRGAPRRARAAMHSGNTAAPFR